jgi:hypothetical protein
MHVTASIHCVSPYALRHELLGKIRCLDIATALESNGTYGPPKLYATISHGLFTRGLFGGFMRFNLSLLRCVVSLGVFAGLTAGTAFADSNPEAVVHDCPNESVILSLNSQWSAAFAVADDSQYTLSKKLAIQELACSENANVDKYFRDSAKLSYAGDLAVYAGADNLSRNKRFQLYANALAAFTDLAASVFPDISQAAKDRIPGITNEMNLTATSP